MLQRRSYKNRAEYLDSIPPFGFIVNLRSSALRFLQHPQLACFIRPHAFLVPDQVPPSRYELLRKLLGFTGLHFKLLRRLFLCEHEQSSSQFAFFVLNRVASKLARKTPDMEAAALVTWMKEVREAIRADDNDWLDNHAPPHCLADEMSELSTSANGRYALAAAGACEVVVDIMLLNIENSVEGCQEISSMCMRSGWSGCECLENSCNAHRCYVRAVLLMSCCREGSVHLRSTEWNQHWPVVKHYVSDCQWQLSQGEPLALVDDLIVKLRTKSPEPMVLHYLHRCAGKNWCQCGKLHADCKILSTAMPGNGSGALPEYQVIIHRSHDVTQYDTRSQTHAMSRCALPSTFFMLFHSKTCRISVAHGTLHLFSPRSCSKRIV
jgi:hypothetical protein